MMVRATAAGLLAPLLLLARGASDVSSFAISSSSAPKRRKVTNQKKAAGGFARKADDSVAASHARDGSASTERLVDFLLGWKSEGLAAAGPSSSSSSSGGGTEAEGGAEVGFDAASGIRGAYAAKSFKRGDIICKIPSDVALALTDPSAATDEATSAVDGAVNFLKWYQNDERARKTWADYLDTLPTREAHFDPTPDFYSDEEIEQLEFPMIIKQAKERKEQIAELSRKENIPFDELQFATWLVASRSFAIKISVDDDPSLLRETGSSPATGAAISSTSQKAIRVLLPFLDMINHSSDAPNAELHLIDPEKDDAWFAIRATRPIRRGKEIAISYGAAGAESSAGLLMNYGFVPDKNGIDSVMLKRGGEDHIDSSGGWTTTLEEDEASLAGATGNMVNVLKLRIRLKRAHPSEK